MNNERFTVPEILFHPSDVGVTQMGIGECIMHVVNAFPKEIQQQLLNNILVIGGSAKFPGMKERIYNEIRSLAPIEHSVEVTIPSK
jgi:actin-related protein 6